MERLHMDLDPHLGLRHQNVRKSALDEYGPFSIP